MADTPMLTARCTFSIGSRIVTEGELVPADDPVVAGRLDLFAEHGSGVRVAATVPGHVLAPATPAAAPPSEPEPGPGRPGQGDPKARWAEYAAFLDPSAVLDGLTKLELIALCDEIEQADEILTGGI